MDATKLLVKNGYAASTIIRQIENSNVVKSK
jgi:hypothetical protein